MKISIEQDDGTFVELPKPLEVSLRIEDQFGPRTEHWVSPEHPNLYGVALRAEAKADKALMRAAIKAANDAQKGDA
jgi:hypothetical protein